MLCIMHMSKIDIFSFNVITGSKPRIHQLYVPPIYVSSPILNFSTFNVIIYGKLIISKDQFQSDFQHKSTQIMLSLIYIYMNLVEIYQYRSSYHIQQSNKAINPLILVKKQFPF